MSFANRVVIDTSTLVGAMLLPRSVPRQALEVALARCTLCSSEATLAELVDVVERRKFDRYLAPNLRQAFADLIRRHGRLFAVTAEDLAQLSPHCRDARDDKFLALAMVCEAQAVVSSDDDLVSMSPFHGIAILTPAAFLAQASESGQLDTR